MSERSASVDPHCVYFTFSRIRPKFSCGRPVAQTLADIVEGRLKFSDLPPLTLLYDRGTYFSLNNRRLYVAKELRRRGLIETVDARVKNVPQTRRMKHKYTKETCALEATLMREGDVTEGQQGSDGGEKDDSGDRGAQPPTARAPSSRIGKIRTPSVKIL